MNAKFKQLFDSLKSLISFKVDSSMSDDDFIAGIDAANLFCKLHDDFGISRTEIRGKMEQLYPEIVRRVYNKENIQQAIPMIKALYRFIYGRSFDDADRGPDSWRNTLVEMCCKVVKAYREKPLIPSYSYLYALSTVALSCEHVNPTDSQECEEILDSYLSEIESASFEELIHYVGAYLKCRDLIGSESNEKWSEVRSHLYDMDIKTLDDNSLIEWCDITYDIPPLKELKIRAANSKRMQVKYLQALAFNEFERAQQASAKRKLVKDLKCLNDDIISDIIDIEINSDMAVPTLQALDTIFNLRLDLAEISSSDNVTIFRRLCKDRREKISKVLLKKYRTAISVNEKIEILELIYTVGQSIDITNFKFTIEEVSKLEQLSGLTYSQRLRLSWICDNSPEISNEVFQTLLRQAANAFDMATVVMSEDVTPQEESDVIFFRFSEIFGSALANNDRDELGRLLVMAANWNIDPIRCKKLETLINDILPTTMLSLPERRVNAIAAGIYAHLATLKVEYTA